MQLDMAGTNLAGLALRVRTIAADDIVFIYAEPDRSDLELLLKEQLYRDLVAELLCQTDCQIILQG
jgi:hypothetical protein